MSNMNEVKPFMKVGIKRTGFHKKKKFVSVLI